MSRASPGGEPSAEQGTSTPTVSVILPTYQRRELVKRAVASVLAQTYRDFELIVVDDGSTDGTREVLENKSDTLRYHWQPNRGVAAARNAGIELAQGSIIAFLDSDDVWLPDHLAVVTEMLQRNPAAVLASTCPGYVIAGREQTTQPRLVQYTANEVWAAGAVGFSPCIAVRREALLALGGFDERLTAIEDSDMWRRLSALGPFCVVRRRTVVCHDTPGSLREQARKSGEYLRAAEVSAANLASAAERLPDGKRARVAQHARGMQHVARAMLAIDRGDVAVARTELDAACRLATIGAVHMRMRVLAHMPRTHEPRELMRVYSLLAELWPERRSDTARYMRALAIGAAIRSGRFRDALELFREWPRGGTLQFARRMAPLHWLLVHRSRYGRHRA